MMKKNMEIIYLKRITKNNIKIIKINKLPENNSMDSQILFLNIS